MPENVSDLVEDLASDLAEGSPAIVLVENYLERAKLAESLIEEADLHGIDMVSLSGPEEAQERLPATGETDATRRAALVLIDADAAGTWAPWLEANREALPQWVRFLIVLMTASDVPNLSRLAPAFMSWAKGLEITKLDIPAGISEDEVAAELARLTQETGMSGDEFVDAWKRGVIPDTFRNTTWLNLAWAASRREPR